MKDFNVWYDGMVIDHLKAGTLAAARSLAKKMYSRPVVVTSNDCTAEENAAAKAESLKLAQQN